MNYQNFQAYNRAVRRVFGLLLNEAKRLADKAAEDWDYDNAHENRCGDIVPNSPYNEDDRADAIVERVASDVLDDPLGQIDPIILGGVFAILTRATLERGNFKYPEIGKQLLSLEQHQAKGKFNG